MCETEGVATLREELSASLGPVQLSDLRAHLARDAVIVVAPTLDLLDVGEALARDDKATVGRWIESNEIAKPSLEVIERWSNQEGSTWSAIVVQPFVLVTELAVES
ncbi:hypothetical protein BH09MYX1_BH09MYX1_45000 [soil metagenome]